MNVSETPHPRNVLIVDCDGDVSSRTSRTLEARGYVVHRAQDGASAVWMLRRMPIDLIVLDLCCDNAKELLALRDHDPRLADIPLLLITVSAGELVSLPPHTQAASPTQTLF